MVPSGYDPITLNHWLWYKYQCHERSPADFQRLFEEIIKRARPEFIQIRPYGNIGDRKCDGLFHADGTVFQVYSPDDLKQAELQKKIKEDCDGAVKHWKKTIKKWVFVYNARRGLPPDIPGTLDEQRHKHPELTIDPMSADELWEMARGLSVQQRSEVLGAPSGYEHLFFTPGTSDADVEQAIDKRHFVLVQDIMSPVNLRDVADALAPAKPFGAPLWIRPSVGELPWTAAAAEQADMVEEAISNGRDLLPKFSVFSFAQIPLAIHLGFVLSTRVEVACYQHDRVRKTWRWPDDAAGADTEIIVRGAPGKKTSKSGDAVIRVSLSAKVAPEETRPVVTGAVEIDLSVKNPDVMWLRSPAQLDAVGTAFREALRSIRDNMPGCQRIQLFCAVPPGASVVIGQQINPRMNPPVELYEYSRQWEPRYRHALTLQEHRTAGNSTGVSFSPPTTPIGGNARGVVIQFVAGDRGGGPRAQLQIPREERKIREAIALGSGHDSFAFAPPEFAASIDDVISCHQRRPAIVHFAGHGEDRQMVLVRDRDPLVEMMRLHPEQAEVLFRNFPVRVRLVLFNTCHSIELARHLVERDVVDLAIGIEGKISDDHAVRFAATFYRQVAEGRSVRVAFDLAGVHVGDLDAGARPQLLCAANVDPAAVTFCSP